MAMPPMKRAIAGSRGLSFIGASRDDLLEDLQAVPLRAGSAVPLSDHELDNRGPYRRAERTSFRSLFHEPRRTRFPPHGVVQGDSSDERSGMGSPTAPGVNWDGTSAALARAPRLVENGAGRGHAVETCTRLSRFGW